MLYSPKQKFESVGVKAKTLLPIGILFKMASFVENLWPALRLVNAKNVQNRLVVLHFTTLQPFGALYILYCRLARGHTVIRLIKQKSRIFVNRFTVYSKYLQLTDYSDYLCN